MSEQHTKLSREEIARRDIGHTDISHGLACFLTVFFLVVIGAVPLLQHVSEFRAIAREKAASPGDRPERLWPQCWDVLKLIPTRAELKNVAASSGARDVFSNLKAINNRMLKFIPEYEEALKDHSDLIQWLIPHMQGIVTGVFKGGNEDAYCGRGDWLFYRRDVDYLTGRGFLEPQVLATRAASGNEWKAPPQPDPIKAIVDFRDQLRNRGIELLVMPTPVKPMIHPEKYSPRSSAPDRPLQNRSYAEFASRLQNAGVHIFDPAQLLVETARKDGIATYLETDTHWTPDGMERTAAALAATIRSTFKLPDVPKPEYSSAPVAVTNHGDIAAMLKLPTGQRSYKPQAVTIRQVSEKEPLWRPSRNADVLLLGDSFSNIYALEPMGWGEAAGFAERLSVTLERPLDTLLRNDAGSHSTRQMLATELKRGNDRLAGKKLVIWQFAARELACGDWKLIPLELGEKRVGTFVAPEPGAEMIVTAVVDAAAVAPRPGSVAYKDHIIAAHLVDVEGAGVKGAKGEALVFIWSMRDNVWTKAARYRQGDKLKLKLKAWSDVASKYDAIKRDELLDEELLAEEPCWGEEIK